MICWITLLRICSAFSSSDGGKQVADAGPNLSFRRHLPPLAATHRQPVPKKKCQNWFQSVELPEHQMIKAAT